MKKTFRHYRNLTKSESDEIWTSGIIVLDTNVLLDFYCYGKETLEDYYTVLKKAKSLKQLWLPYQVGLEFFENRLSVINKQLKQYDNLLTYLGGARERIAELKNTSPNHAHLDFDSIATQYETAILPLKKSIERLKDNHPDYLGEDNVLRELEKIFSEGIIGKAYDDVTLESIAKEGDERYSKKIPPGYKDQDKKESGDKPERGRKYGDLIIWKQILDKASHDKRPIIFVTNDAKEDWVLFAKEGRKLGPQPALRKEILTQAQADFLLYSADEFLEEAHKRFNLPIKNESLSEVKKYRELSVVHTDDYAYYGRYRPFLYSAAGVNDHYLRELHNYLHRAQRISAEAVHSAHLQEGAPRRLIETMHEVHGLYSTIHSSISHHGVKDRHLLKHLADRQQVLLRRASNIIREGAEPDWMLPKSVRELLHLNDRIYSLIDNTQNELDLTE